MNRSLDQWQQSIKALYNDAVQSPRPGHIYKEVLLACALAEVDDLRFFTTAAVRPPLARIAGKEFDAFHYARHLKELSEPGARPRSSTRGGIVPPALSDLESNPEALHHHARRQGQIGRQGSNPGVEKRGG